MSRIIELVLPPIVTLSKPVEDGCVEIFAGQIFDLASQKLQSRRTLQGIVAHDTTYTRVHLHL